MNQEDKLFDKLNEYPVSCFYRVSESVVSFDEDPEKSFFWHEDFKGQNLLLLRGNAITHFGNRLIQFNMKGFNETFFGKSFSIPENYVPGENYAYSITLEFIGIFQDGEQDTYYLQGEDEEEISEGKDFEIKYYKHNGFDDSQIEALEKDLFLLELLIGETHRFFVTKTFKQPDSEFHKMTIEMVMKRAVDEWYGGALKNFVEEKFLK